MDTYSKSLILTIIVFLLFSLSGCDDTEAQRPDIHGLISVIEHNENTVYIIGSMHSGFEHWYPLNYVVESAMINSDVFVFEFDPNAFGDICMCVDIDCNCYDYECICLIENLWFFGGGRTLGSYLSVDVLENFIAVLSTYESVSILDIAHLQPIPAVSFIQNTETYYRLGLNSYFGVDHYVNEFALSNDKPTIGLEGFNEHFLVLLDMPRDYQISWIKNLSDSDTLIEEFTNMILRYENQDVEAMIHAIRGSLQRAYEKYDMGLICSSILGFERYFDEVMIVERSILFAERIGDLLRETDEPTTFFVTVGIGHLIGDDFGNVFNVLTHNGFEVIPLYETE